MNLYFELLKGSTFTIDDVNQHYDNWNSARSAVNCLIEDDMVAKIQWQYGSAEIRYSEQM